PEPRVSGIRPAPPKSWSPPPTAVTSLPSLRGPARSTTPGADWKGCQVTWAEAWPAVRTAAANPIAAAVAHRRAIRSRYRAEGDRLEHLTALREGDPGVTEPPLDRALLGLEAALSEIADDLIRARPDLLGAASDELSPSVELRVESGLGHQRGVPRQVPGDTLGERRAPAILRSEPAAVVERQVRPVPVAPGGALEPTPHFVPTAVERLAVGVDQVPLQDPPRLPQVAGQEAAGQDQLQDGEQVPELRVRDLLEAPGRHH